jgi:hypothetical protein
MLYLASDESKIVIGEELVIDGGWTTHWAGSERGRRPFLVCPTLWLTKTPWDPPASINMGSVAEALPHDMPPLTPGLPRLIRRW